jgi:hypothetical protein
MSILSHMQLACDHCGGSNYTDDNPMVELRRPRATKPTELCTVLAGHRKCFMRGSERIFTAAMVGPDGAMGTHEQWEEWLKANPGYTLD